MDNLNEFQREVREGSIERTIEREIRTVGCSWSVLSTHKSKIKLRCQFTEVSVNTREQRPIGRCPDCCGDIHEVSDKMGRRY
jgi:hypothetical protein